MNGAEARGDSVCSARATVRYTTAGERQLLLQYAKLKVIGK
jgi:hypothetical protein